MLERKRKSFELVKNISNIVLKYVFSSASFKMRIDEIFLETPDKIILLLYIYLLLGGDKTGNYTKLTITQQVPFIEMLFPKKCSDGEVTNINIDSPIY